MATYTITAGQSGTYQLMSGNFEYVSSGGIVDDGVLYFSAVNDILDTVMTGGGIIAVAGTGTNVTINPAGSAGNPPFPGFVEIAANDHLVLDQPDALGSAAIVFGDGESGTLEIDGTTTPLTVPPETIEGLLAGNTIIIEGVRATPTRLDLVWLAKLLAKTRSWSGSGRIFRQEPL